ncbi:MAG: hypothetical protein QXV54_03105 [Desulfurococcaceae archaeon]
MDSTNICKLIYRNLYCSRELEALTSMVLKLYSEKLSGFLTMMNEVKTILSLLSIESSKHAEMIDLILRFFEFNERVNNCDQIVGEPWNVLQNLIISINEGTPMDLHEFINKQKWVENAIGEETYHKLLMPLVSRSIQLGCLEEHRANIVIDVLSKLKQDEEWHEELLKKLTYLKTPSQ